MELSVYLAHQPIFDRHGQVFAYELLYRDTHDNAAHVSNHLHATARVLVNTLNYVGLQTLTNGRIAFIKVDDTVIMDKIVLTVPPRSFVHETRARRAPRIGDDRRRAARRRRRRRN